MHVSLVGVCVCVLYVLVPTCMSNSCVCFVLGQNVCWCVCVLWLCALQVEIKPVRCVLFVYVRIDGPTVCQLRVRVSWVCATYVNFVCM